MLRQLTGQIHSHNMYMYIYIYMYIYVHINIYICIYMSLVDISQGTSGTLVGGRDLAQAEH